MAKYGIPYMGSKGGIAELIIKFLPNAENIYDLFGGGFSISHCAMLSKKFKNVFYNEINADVVALVRKAINGEYNYNVFKPEWISREMFFKRKDSCAYTRVIWSFGNNQKGYMFGADIEQQKKALHNAVVFNVFSDLATKLTGLNKFPAWSGITQRRLLVKKIFRGKPRIDLQQLQQLEQLQRLERLQRLRQLERLRQLQMTSLSYEGVQIKPDSIIYCDPPYKGTASYLNTFDHEKFWQWARTSKHPVFVSEYNAPKDFKIALSLDHKKSLSAKANSNSVEKLFCNEAASKILSKVYDQS